MGQGYRCIHRLVSHRRSENLLFFLKVTLGLLQQDAEGKMHRTIKSSSAKGKGRNTISVEDSEKEATTLFPPQRQSHSESPKPDFFYRFSVNKQALTRRNRETLDHYHDRGFLEQSSGLWQSTKGAFSGFTLYHVSCSIGHLPSLCS
jgi:hypothetical protein